MGISLSLEKRVVLKSVVDCLSQIDGVAAIVLGGSYASGYATAKSDIDVGVYYREESPFSIGEIAEAADVLSEGAAPVVTDFYDWGNWVNGGAWLQTGVGRVDLLYRNLDQIERTIRDAIAGCYEQDYLQQPPFGFYNVTYLAETQIAAPLFDPMKEMARLKARVQVYPPNLRQRVVEQSLWSSEFTLAATRPHARDGNLYLTVSCLSRVIANLTQALFAINERFFLSDKHSSSTLADFRLLPSNYSNRIDSIFSDLDSTPDTLWQKVVDTRQIWMEVVDFAGQMYVAKYPLDEWTTEQ